MPRKPSQRTDNWAAAFGAALREKEQRPPGDGWKTSHELRAQMQVGRCKFYDILRTMKLGGRIEHFLGTTTAGGGKLVRCDWYRLK